MEPTYDDLADTVSATFRDMRAVNAKVDTLATVTRMLVATILAYVAFSMIKDIFNASQG